MEQSLPCIEDTKKPKYKYCNVHKCKNTKRNAPDKMFFLVPRGAESRRHIKRKWSEILKRDMVSPSPCLFYCEDHFDVEEDTDNHLEYTIMNLQEKQKNTLKKGVLPQKLQCQKDTESQLPPMREGFLNRNHSEPIEVDLSPPLANKTFCLSDSSSENSLEGFTCSSSSPVYMEDTQNKDDCQAGCSTPLSNVYNENEMLVDKAIQMNSKIYNNNKNGYLLAKSAAVSPLPILSETATTSCLKIAQEPAQDESEQVPELLFQEEPDVESMSSAQPSLLWSSALEPDTSSHESTWIIEIF